MKPTVWGQLDTVSRQWTPFALSVFAALLAAVPMHLPGFYPLNPIWPLMAIYFWSVRRPDLMPPVAVFIVGLLHDSLGGGPIGVSAIVFVGVHTLVAAERRLFSGQAFAMMWLGFAVVAAVALMLSWVLASAWYGAALPADALFFQYVLTVGCFPLLASVLHGWHRLLLQDI